MPSERQFRDTLGRFASGVTVVTAADADEAQGMTATAFTSLSLDPMLVLVCVRRYAWFHDLVLRAGGFAVTVLAARQREVSTWFASPRPAGYAQFTPWRWQRAPGSGAPLLDGGLAHVDCQLADAMPGGDHTVLVGRVTHLAVPAPDADPLVWFRGAYAGLEPVAVTG
jgi:flavin reductase (DIM6/NTAB) family NADH-FMN oxidoreductase RutF